MKSFLLKISATIAAVVLLAGDSKSQTIEKVGNDELTTVLAAITGKHTFSNEEVYISIYTANLESDVIPNSEGHDLYTRLYITVSEIGTHAPTIGYVIKNLLGVDKINFKEVDKKTIIISFKTGGESIQTRVLKVNPKTLALESKVD